MNSANNQPEPQEKQRYLIKKIPRIKEILVRRLPIAMLLIYYIFILFGAWSTPNWWWSPEDGVKWTSGGPGSFLPFPSEAGILAIITPASLIDQVFYLFFMHQGIWIIWISLGFLYIFSPYRLDVKVALGKLRKRGS